MLKMGFETWTYIIKSCDKIFEEEPILEGAMGLTCKFVNRRNGKSVPIFFVMKWMIPFWRIIKKNLHITGTFGSGILLGKNQIANIMDKDTRGKSYCLFSTNFARPNYFGSIFMVMKKLDDMGVNSILFTNYNVYLDKKKEIGSLKNNSVVFTENLSYNLTSSEIIKCFMHTYRLFNKLMEETKDNDVIDFIKKYRHELIFRIEEIVIFSEAVSKILKNKNCRFYLSQGGFFSLISVCKKYGIKTAMMQHGSFGNVENHSEYKIHPPECSPHADDEIIVWGNYHKDKVKHLYNYGPERKILVLGNPIYDIIVKKFLGKDRSREFYNKLALDRKKKTVVFFSQAVVLDLDQEQPPERFIKPMFALDKLYEQLNSKINLVIKLHPLETKKHYEKHMKNLNDITLIEDEVSIYELYQHTDISMSVSSTTTLESMIFKIPTLQLVLSRYGVRGDSYYKYGAAILIKNTDELIDVVERIVSGTYVLSNLIKNQEKYLKNSLVNLGTATDKIVEHLLESITGCG